MPELINIVGKYKTKTAVAQPSRNHTTWIVIHHAGWYYPRGQALQKIFEFHSGQWPRYGRIGYHEVIQEEPDGRLQRYQVNEPDLIGAGVWGQNPHCYHICMARHNQNEIPPQHWIDETARAAADARKRYPDAQIVGHTEITLLGHGTDCPGPRWKAWKPGFVAQVGRIFVPVLPPVPPAPVPFQKAYRVKGIPIYQRSDGSGPLAGYLQPGEQVVIDAIYPQGTGHLVSGLGFVDLDALEPV